MLVTNVQDIRRYSAVIDSEDLLVYTRIKDGGTYIYRAIKSDSLGPLLQSKMQEKSEDRKFLLEESMDGDWIWQVYFFEGEMLKPLSQFGGAHFSYAAHFIDYVYSLIANYSKKSILPLAKFDKEIFFEETTGIIRHLPILTFPVTDRMNFNSLMSEIPKVYLNNFPPEVLKKPKEIQKPESYLFLLTSCFGSCLLGDTETQFYRNWEEDSLEEDFKLAAKSITEKVNKIFSLPLKSKVFSVDPNERIKDYHSYRNALSLEFYRIDNRSAGEPNILARIGCNYIFGSLKGALKKANEFFIQQEKVGRGSLLVFQGKSGTGKSSIVDYMCAEEARAGAFVVYLTEQERTFDVEKSPLYDLINSCINQLTQYLRANNLLFENFKEEFQNYLFLFSGLNQSFAKLNLDYNPDFKGSGSFSDKEVYEISYRLLRFLSVNFPKVVLQIDGDFSLGISRAITNTNQIVNLINSLPIQVIGTVNEGSSEFMLCYRLIDAGVKQIKIVPIPELSKEDAKKYLSMIGLNELENESLVVQQLHSLSKAKLSSLREILVYTLRQDFFSLKENGVVWNLEKLNPEFLPFDAKKVGLDVIHSLSTEDLTMLKRLALVKTFLPVSLLTFGIEHYGETGARKLERIGLLRESEVSKQEESCFQLENSYVREEILSEIDRKEKVFLSIQLARAICSTMQDSEFLEASAELWGKNVDYINADSDRLRALESFIKMARKYLSISDYKCAERYLHFAQRVLGDLTVMDAEKQIEVKELYAVVCFRTKDLKSAQENFDWVLNAIDDRLERAKVRNTMIELFSLQGSHHLARELAFANFKDLEIDPLSIVGFKDMLVNFTNVYWGIESKVKGLKNKVGDSVKRQRIILCLESIRRVAASFYQISVWDYVKLTLAAKKLSRSIGENKFLAFARLSDAVEARVLFNNIEISRKFFDSGLEIAKRAKDELLISRAYSLRELFQGSVLSEDKKVIANLGKYAKRSFVAHDEVFFVYSELNKIIQMILSGLHSFNDIYEDLLTLKYQSEISNRAEAVQCIYGILEFLHFARGAKIREEDLTNVKSLEENYNQSSLTSFIFHFFKGLKDFFREDYKAAHENFKISYDGKATSYSYPHEVNLLFFAALNLHLLCQNQRPSWQCAKYRFELFKIRKRFFALTKHNKKKFSAKRRLLKALGFPGRKITPAKIDGIEASQAEFVESKDHLGVLLTSSLITKVLVADSQLFRASKYLEESLKSSEFLSFEWVVNKMVRSFSKGELTGTVSPKLSQEVSGVSITTDNELGSVIKLIQEIGKDERIESSLGRVLEMIADTSGADRAIYLLPVDSELRWEIISLYDHGYVDLTGLSPSQIKNHELFSVDVVNYCYELRKQVILGNASSDSSFKDDPYISGYEVKSIFCLPVLGAEGIIGVIYLENNRKADSFSKLSVEVPTLLASLAHSLHEKAALYNSLESKVVERTEKLREAQKELTNSAFQAGMAEVATETIHNLGNLLNSISVESSDLKNQLTELKMKRLPNLKKVLESYSDTADENLSKERFRDLVDYFKMFANYLEDNIQEVETGSDRISERVGMIRSSIQSQQEFAKNTGYSESIPAKDLLEQVVEVLKPQLVKYKVNLTLNVDDQIVLRGIRSKVAQIFMNLIKNSVDALSGQLSHEKKITITVDSEDENYVTFSIRDNGIGISFEDQTHVFEYGYTTKDKGHGFGLHSVAMMLDAMGGSIELESAGLGRGCEFRIKFSKTDS
jgi:signal transduction histidine kinase